MSSDLVVLAADLYAFIDATEPRRARRSAALESWRQRGRELLERTSHFMRDPRHAQSVRTLLEDTTHNLRRYVGTLEASSAATSLRSSWKSLGKSYENLVAHIRQAKLPVPQDVYLGHIKPTNYARNAFHIFNGLLGVVLYELIGDRWIMAAIAGTILAAFTIMDVSRRFFPTFNKVYVEKIFGAISRPVDAHKTPSSNWYVLGLLLGVILLPKLAVQVGVLALAFGDPAASIVGRRLGGAKIFRDKTWAGSIAFAASAVLVTVPFMLWASPEMSIAAACGYGALVGIIGALAEIFGDGVLDDNFTIPLVAGGAMALLM